MVQLAVVLTNHHRLLSVAAILDVFETVNRFYIDDGLQPFYKIHMIGGNTTDFRTYGNYPLLPANNETRFDLVLIPAFMEDHMPSVLAANHDFAGWLRQQHGFRAEIASVCTGAFLLAHSGLLDGKAATTHMDSTNQFAKTFPEVHLRANAIITEDQGIYTSGGSISSFHLLLHLIEHHSGRKMAIRTAKHFAIDMDRSNQSYFGTFRPIVTHQDELVKKLQERIKNEYADISSIEDLLNDIPASRRNLVRRFKHTTGNTPIEYLQKTRIEAAKRCLEQTPGGVLESMVEAGYSDLKAFRQLFKKTVGMTPSAYRNKYNRRTAA